MKLFNGSNVEVCNPRIILQDRKLDFGTGFYLTAVFEQAEKWAEITTLRRKNGQPTVSVYEFDEDVMSNLKVLQFNSPDKDWLRFVSLHRKDSEITDNYDIIIGPIANDKTMPVISLYFAGVYSEEEAIKRLLPQKLSNQIVFKTDKSLGFLKFEGIIEK